MISSKFINDPKIFKISEYYQLKFSRADIHREMALRNTLNDVVPLEKMQYIEGRYLINFVLGNHK